jgi:hypothetical protein
VNKNTRISADGDLSATNEKGKWMEKSEVLIVTSNRNMRRHITRALGSAGFEVRHSPMDRAAVVKSLNPAPKMCIVDVDEQHQQAEIRWLLDLLYSEHKEVISLLISQDHEMPFVRESLTTKNLNNLIAKHGGLSAASELIDESEVIVTCQKLCRHDIFGLDKYLTTWGIKVLEREITGTESKLEIMSELDEYLDRIDCWGAVKNSVMLVADELIMNAIFNAPRDNDGNAKYATLDRSEDLLLEPDETAVFRYACDGRNIALSVTDSFGSLDRDVIIRYLQRCFDGGPAEVEEKEGGAGLGLHMVFNSITQLTFNIQAGVSTEVIAAFYVRSGSLAFKTSGRSLNIFFLTGNGEAIG